MKFDIRIPIGAMFTILGVLLVVYGIVSDAEIYRPSFGINVNLLWGAVLLLFGLIMGGLARRASRAEATRAARAAGTASALGEPAGG